MSRDLQLAARAELELRRRRREAADARYREDCWAWCCEQVITLDEASQRALPWPRHLWYVSQLMALWSQHSLVAVPKSRRMFVSWALAAWCTWLARYHPHHAIYWVSEVEQKAAFAVDQRCLWIERNLTDVTLRRSPDTVRTTRGLVGRITYPETGSYIWAVAQGGDVLRAYTPSVIILDEVEFQSAAAETVKAVLPLVEKGARCILVSSSAGPTGILAELCSEIGFARWDASWAPAGEVGGSKKERASEQETCHSVSGPDTSS